MNCPNCGKEIQSRFCDRCGYGPIEETTQPTVGTENQQPIINSGIISENGTQQPAHSTTPNQYNGKKLALIITMVCVLSIAGLAAIIFAVWLAVQISISNSTTSQTDSNIFISDSLSSYSDSSTSYDDVIDTRPYDLDTGETVYTGYVGQVLCNQDGICCKITDFSRNGHELRLEVELTNVGEQPLEVYYSNFTVSTMSQNYEIESYLAETMTDSYGNEVLDYTLLPDSLVYLNLIFQDVPEGMKTDISYRYFSDQGNTLFYTPYTFILEDPQA